MDAVEEIPNQSSKDFLLAEDLVSLRKPEERNKRPVIGNKLNFRSKSQRDDEDVRSTLEYHKDFLKMKRTAKVCDLVKANWDDTLKVAVVPKLKGKYAQHMGQVRDGKVLLAPEESIFLLENGAIEILNGEATMSTEEAYATILTGNLAHEKYEVYSHLSRLGYVVLSHQNELTLTNREKSVNLNKHKLNQKRKNVDRDSGEPAGKRLNFTGAFSEINTLSDTFDSQDVTSTCNIEIVSDQTQKINQGFSDQVEQKTNEVSNDKVSNSVFKPYESEPNSISSVHENTESKSVVETTEGKISNELKVDDSGCLSLESDQITKVRSAEDTSLNNNLNSVNSSVNLDEGKAPELTVDTDCRTEGNQKTNLMDVDSDAKAVLNVIDVVNNDFPAKVAPKESDIVDSDSRYQAVSSEINFISVNSPGKVASNEIGSVNVDSQAKVASSEIDSLDLNSQVKGTLKEKKDINADSLTKGTSSETDIIDVDCQAEVAPKETVVTIGDSVKTTPDEIGILEVDSQVKGILKETGDMNTNSQAKVSSSEVDVIDVNSQVEIPSKKAEDANSQVKVTSSEVDIIDVDSQVINVPKDANVIDDGSRARAVSSEVDIMDVDSENTQNSFKTSEVLKDRIDSASVSSVLVNAESNSVGVVEEKNSEASNESYCFVESDEDVLSLGVDSDDSICAVPEECVDEDITVLEVTKKETKPLDVIDLSDDEKQTEDIMGTNDDDIMVIEECSKTLNATTSPPRPTITQSSKLSAGIFGNTFNNLKKEERGGFPSNSNRTLNTLTQRFPKVRRNDVVCVPRPPLDLLPFHILPSKELYVIDFNHRAGNSSNTQGRLWNSFREMQDYQRRSRLENRHPDQPFSRPMTSQCPQDRGINPWIQEPHHSATSQDYKQNNSSASNGNLPTNNYNAQPFAATNTPRPFILPSPPFMSGGGNPQSELNLMGNHAFRPVIPTSAFTSRFSFANHGFVQQDLLPGSFSNHNIIRAVHSIASDVVSVIINQHLPGFQRPNAPNLNGTFPPFSHNTFGNYSGQNGFNDRFSYQRRNFGNRVHRGQPFPSRFNNVRGKRSWEQVRTTIGEDTLAENDGSDIEEVPITAREILWDPNNICPIVKPGVPTRVSDILSPLRITHLAKLTEKSSACEKSLPSASSLEISFDIYLPGFNWKRTNPGLPKYRVIVVRSADPIPKYSEIAFHQKKWNDGAMLQIAVVDNGGSVSFLSFNSVQLPSLVPHDM